MRAGIGAMSMACAAEATHRRWSTGVRSEDLSCRSETLLVPRELPATVERGAISSPQRRVGALLPSLPPRLQRPQRLRRSLAVQ